MLSCHENDEDPGLRHAVDVKGDTRLLTDEEVVAQLLRCARMTPQALQPYIHAMSACK